MTTKDFQSKPSRDYKFFMYDPYEGLVFFKTEEERDQMVDDSIRQYLDDGYWNDAVTDIFTGVVTHKVVETNQLDRVGELDDDGCDENGECWPDGDCDRKCDHELRPL
ncbi:MAG: hypothetical protein VKO39_03405 [Cyanobacteriota bacterium]|nr:hypothetical protein [Cyanobacteriota bacterium]